MKQEKNSIIIRNEFLHKSARVCVMLVVMMMVVVVRVVIRNKNFHFAPLRTRNGRLS